MSEGNEARDDIAVLNREYKAAGHKEKSSVYHLTTHLLGASYNRDVTFKGMNLSEDKFNATAGRVQYVLDEMWRKKDWTEDLTVWIFGEFESTEELEQDYRERGFELDEKEYEDLKKHSGIKAKALVGDKPMIIVYDSTSNDSIFHELSHQVMTPDLNRRFELGIRLKPGDGGNLSDHAKQVVGSSIQETIRGARGDVRDLITYRLMIKYPQHVRERLLWTEDTLELKRAAYEKSLRRWRSTQPIAFHDIFFSVYALAALAERFDTYDYRRLRDRTAELQRVYIKEMAFQDENERARFHGDVSEWCDAFSRMFNDSRDYEDLIRDYLIPLMQNPLQYGLKKDTSISISIKKL